jgi:hypothetical protein
MATSVACRRSLPLEAGDVLNCCFVGLPRELAQACLVYLMATAWMDADRADMVETFDQPEHAGWLGCLWHVP